MHLFEYTISAGHRVDREAGVIHNVKLLGPRSRNGRRYNRKALKEAAERYEGFPVNADHPSKSNPTEPRPIASRIGRIVNTRDTADGAYGDFEVLRSHPLAGAIFEAAERMPNVFGFSHVADCRTGQANGETVVEGIAEVVSLDVVSKPATVSSFFESEDPMHRTRTASSSRVPELRDWQALKRYCFEQEDHQGPIICGLGGDHALHQRLTEARKATNAGRKRGKQGEDEMPTVTDEPEGPPVSPEKDMTPDAIADVIGSIIDELAAGARPNVPKIALARKAIRQLRKMQPAKADDLAEQLELALVPPANDREGLRRYCFEDGPSFGYAVRSN